MSLRMRLIISYTLVVIVCLSIAAIAVSVLLQSYRDRFTMARLDDITRPIYTQTRLLARNQTPFSEVWSSLKEQAQNNEVHILLTDNEGNIIRQASPQPGQRQPLLEIPPGELPRGISRLQQGTFVTSSGQTYIFAAYPFGRLFTYQQPPDIRTIILAVPRSGTIAIWFSLFRPFLYAGLIALGVSVIFAFFLARSTYRPVQRVAEAAERIAQGQYSHEIAVAGPQEVRGLATGFNQMVKQVQQSQERLRHFVADVSHQLKSPLTSIHGFAQAITDGTASDNDSKLKAAHIIQDESKKMMRQVDELLELSRMQSGQMRFEEKPVDIEELLKQCLEIFTMRADEKKLKLKMDFTSLPTVEGDFDRLEQVFNNLLDNAIKNSSPGGEVQIVGRKTADIVEIRIIDSGPGIPPEQLPYVFERFYQALDVRTGVGLGLAITKEIVLAHDGVIEAKSNPGEATEFIVKLPARHFETS